MPQHIWLCQGVMILILVLIAVSGYAQDKKIELANAYYTQGEYEKAGLLYEKLIEAHPQNHQVFERYVKTLQQLEDYQTAASAVEQRIRRDGAKPDLVVVQGDLYTQMGDAAGARATYQRAIDALPARAGSVVQLANAFQRARKYDMAMNTYEHGAAILKDTMQFVHQLRNLAQYNNDIDRIITYGLMALQKNANQLTNTKSIFTRYIQRDDQPRLQGALYGYIQRYPDVASYQEMLIWSMLAQDDFSGALRQARSMDRKYEENGSRIYTLSQSAINHKDYDAAIKALQYILDNKGRTNNYYPVAKADILRCKRHKILQDGGGIEELRSLVPEYEAYFAEEGQTSANAYVLLSYARFQNQYLKNVDRSIELLEDLTQVPGVKPFMVADAKLELGDHYLLKGDRWEATLRYAQVDKDHPEDDRGEQARYRNALLSYYVGDFAWAQEQFDILKASTSKIISNDAIDRSVFITANMGLDSTDAPLKQYANAELLIFQRRYAEALASLDDLLLAYPSHDLEDDVYYLRGRAYADQEDWANSLVEYVHVAHDFADDIRADNAIYAIAELHSDIYKDQQTAAKMYEKLFLEYKDSTYAITARKRYRALVEDLGVDAIDAQGKTLKELYDKALSREQ